MKDTCKQTSQPRTAPRVELICTRGDQPKSRIRIFQHDNPAGKVHDTSAVDNETTTCTHDAHTPEDVTNVKDGVCSATRTQQATSHNSNQFSVNHT